jgi:hypothetical protein
MKESSLGGGHLIFFQTKVFHAMLMVFSENSQWVEAHKLGLGLFGIMVWKLLIIEPFFQWFLKKSQPKTTLVSRGVISFFGMPLINHI